MAFELKKNLYEIHTLYFTNALDNITLLQLKRFHQLRKIHRLQTESKKKSKGLRYLSPDRIRSRRIETNVSPGAFSLWRRLFRLKMFKAVNMCK